MALRAIPLTGPGGSYRGKTGRGNLWPARRFMTHYDISRLPFAVVHNGTQLLYAPRFATAGHQLLAGQEHGGSISDIWVSGSSPPRLIDQIDRA